MSLVSDMLASYRGPRAVVSRLLGQGVREDRALVYLMAGCLMAFCAQLPRLGREAHLAGESLSGTMVGTLFACLFILPLVFYVLGIVAQILILPLRRLTGYAMRLTLFWAFFAASGPPIFSMSCSPNPCSDQS